MLLIDNIILFPVSSIMWVFRELHEAVLQELSTEAERLTGELSELYMMLETGKITEEEFTEREGKILDRLDLVQERESRLRGEG